MNQKYFHRQLSLCIFVFASITLNTVRGTGLQNDVGLFAPEVTLTFDEVALSENAPLLQNYSAFGIFFTDSKIYFDDNPGESPVNKGNHGRNGFQVGSGSISDKSIPFSIFFNRTVSEAAVAVDAMEALTRFTALLSGVAIDSFEVQPPNAGRFYGFTDTALDEIRIENLGPSTRDELTGFIRFDNIQHSSPHLVFQAIGPAATKSNPQLPKATLTLFKGTEKVGSWPAFSGLDVYWPRSFLADFDDNIINNPKYASFLDHGPIPPGEWKVLPPGKDHCGFHPNAGSSTRRNYIPLCPAPGTDRMGRDNIYIHGPGMSTGCIVLSDITSLLSLLRGQFGSAFEAGGIRLSVQYLNFLDVIPPKEVVPRYKIRLHSPARIVIENSCGHTCGFDETIGEGTCDMEDASYSGANAEPQEIGLSILDGSVFTLRLSAVGAGGEFDLDVSGTNLDGVVVQEAYSGLIQSGEVQTFGLSINGGVITIHREISFKRGDSNASRAIDLSDAIYTLSSLFTGGVTFSCQDAADSNDDGRVDISDPVFSLGFLFLGTAPPPPPGPSTCGPDPTPDDLSECNYDPANCAE